MLTQSDAPETVQVETREVEQLGFAPWVRADRDTADFDRKREVMERWLRRFAQRHGFSATGDWKFFNRPNWQWSGDPLESGVPRNGRLEHRHGGVKCIAVRNVPPDLVPQIEDLLNNYAFSSQRQIYFLTNDLIQKARESSGEES